MQHTSDMSCDLGNASIASPWIIHMSVSACNWLGLCTTPVHSDGIRLDAPDADEAHVHYLGERPVGVSASGE